VEKFSIPRENVIESDKGFSIEVMFPVGMQYVEGQRTMQIDSEVLAPGYGVALFRRSLKRWDPPHERESVDDATRARIIDNISRAFRFSGSRLDIA
jgi:immunity protein 74 of polymorphic toxin system